VRVLFNLGFTLGERHDIQSRGPIETTEFSSSFCEYFCDLVNNGMSFDYKKQVNIQRSVN